MSFICDCGQVYTERAAVRECQAARHSAAAGCELADAEQAARRLGIETDRISEAGDGGPVGSTAAKRDDLFDGKPAVPASGPDVTSSQGTEISPFEALRRQRDAAWALNVKLRNKLLQWAGECAACDGTGCVTAINAINYNGDVKGRVEPCPDCADIREALE